MIFKKTLEKEGFVLNTYDLCVANKVIDGQQCTISWYVEDNKLSHVNPIVANYVLGFLGCFVVVLVTPSGGSGALAIADDDDDDDEDCFAADDVSEQEDGEGGKPSGKQSGAETQSKKLHLQLLSKVCGKHPRATKNIFCPSPCGGGRRERGGERCPTPGPRRLGVSQVDSQAQRRIVYF